MTMQVLNHDHDLQLAAGLGALWSGLGIPGPFGQNPSTKVDAGDYEISGTQVNLHSDASPGTLGSPVGELNGAYGQNNNLVVPPPDQVSFDAQTLVSGGYTYGHVSVKSGSLSGKSGYVALAYMAPIGWTASHNGTGPAQGGGGGGGGGPITPAKDTTSTTTTSDYTPYILAGAGGLGLLIIGWAVFAKPKHGGVHHRAGRRRHTGRRHAR